MFNINLIRMNKFKTVLSLLIVGFFIFLAFGSEDSNSSSTESVSGSAASKSEWTASTTIAGLSFNTNLKFSFDEKRFSHSGSAGGIYFNDSGTYTESGGKIIMNSGKYKNWYFVKDGAILNMYTDEGDFITSLW